MRSVVMPEYHVAQDLGAVVVVFVAVFHEGEPVHVAHVRLPVSPTPPHMTKKITRCPRAHIRQDRMKTSQHKNYSSILNNPQKVVSDNQTHTKTQTHKTNYQVLSLNCIVYPNNFKKTRKSL